MQWISGKWLRRFLSLQSNHPGVRNGTDCNMVDDLTTKSTEIESILWPQFCHDASLVMIRITVIVYFIRDSMKRIQISIHSEFKVTYQSGFANCTSQDRKQRVIPCDPRPWVSSPASWVLPFLVAGGWISWLPSWVNWGLCWHRVEPLTAWFGDKWICWKHRLNSGWSGWETEVWRAEWTRKSSVSTKFRQCGYHGLEWRLGVRWCDRISAACSWVFFVKCLDWQCTAFEEDGFTGSWHVLEMHFWIWNSKLSNHTAKVPTRARSRWWILSSKVRSMSGVDRETQSSVPSWTHYADIGAKFWNAVILASVCLTILTRILLHFEVWNRVDWKRSIYVYCIIV